MVEYNAQTEYCIKDENRNVFLIGDDVTIKTTDNAGVSGTITHITCKGVYINNGDKKDKYFRVSDIIEIRNYK
jgi:hypothetical protein